MNCEYSLILSEELFNRDVFTSCLLSQTCYGFIRWNLRSLLSSWYCEIPWIFNFSFYRLTNDKNKLLWHRSEYKVRRNYKFRNARFRLLIGQYFFGIKPHKVFCKIYFWWASTTQAETIHISKIYNYSCVKISDIWTSESRNFRIIRKHCFFQAFVN